MKNIAYMKNSTILGSAKPTFSSAKLIGKKLSIVNCALLIVFCLFFGGKAWGASLTVYDNTTTNEYVPIYGYWSDSQSKCEFIIPSTKLSQMAGSNISAMKFYLSSSGSNAQISATFQVFVKEVSATTLSAYTGTTGATTVFNQTITINTSASNVELNIPFSSNYSYNGGNLLIGFYQTTTTGWNHTYWFGETQSTNTAWSGYGTQTGSAQTFLPKITFTYDPPAASIPYSHNFENTTENEKWTIVNDNNGTAYTNKWIIGTATSSSSSHSLYISNNGSANTYTNSSTSYVYAYRKLNFSTAGDYNVSFQWKANGESTYDLLRAFLIPVSANPTLSGANGMSSNTNTNPSGWIEAGDQAGKLNLKTDWQTSNLDVSITDIGDYYLVFFWKNDNSQGSNPPAAVDDVSVIVAPDTYKAEWVSAEVGSTSSWCIGETRTVTLQVKNTGTATWYNSTANGGDGSGNQTDHDMVAVSYKWDEDEWYDSHPNTRNHFDRNIAPGETATITFNVEGPRKSGANHLRFNLIRQECCWFSYQNNCSNALEKVVDVTVPALTLSASNSVICNGGSSTLTTNCDLTANIYTAQPYIWDWNSSSYTGNNHITEASVDRSILKFKTTGNDPMINMYSIGSFNPSVYKYVRMKYRIVEGSNPGSVEIFFVSSTGANTGGATTGYSRSTSLNADHQWHIAEINMSAHASWVANGNVTGWRLDPCGSSNTIKMEIDWIGLFPDPIATNVSTYTATPSQTTTYYACNYVENRPYIHLAPANVAVVSEVSISLSSSPAALECITSGTSVTLTANAGGVIFSDGFEDGLGNWTVTSGDSNYQWSKKAGTGGSTYTTAHNGSFNAGAYYNNGRTNTYTYLRLNTDLSSYSDVKLSYWYMNPAWGSDVDYFYVQYSTDGTNYYDLSSTSSSHTTWTEVSNVPIPAGTKYIRFAAYNDYGYGAAVDDVKISISTAPTWAATGTAGTASGSTYTVTPKALSNTYTASASFSGCAEQQQSVTITTKPTVTVSSSTGNSDACDGSDVLLTATSNATDFVWSNNAGTDPVVTVHPTASTTYYVTASSATCTNSASISINVKTSPTITASPDIASTCFDGSTQVTLTASGAANVESWAVDENFEGYSGTAYNVEGPIPSGWNVIATGNYSKYSPHVGTPYPGVIAGNYSLCFISGGSDYGANNYAILPACSNPIYISFDYKFESTSSGTLTLGYITNANDATTYEVLETITPSTSNRSVAYNLSNFPSNARLAFRWTYSSSWYTCGIDNVKVKVSAPPAYTWSSTGTAGSASGATYTVTPSEGTNTYTVSVDGCSRSITIDVLTANNITASGETTDCGVPVTLSASGIEGATYDWYDGNTLVQANSPSFTPTDIINGKTYNVKVSKEIYGDVYEDVRTFTYTGTVQSVTIPEGAVAAKLEVWGAQGGYRSNSSYGGKGGYSVGTISSPTIGQTLYVVVGGSGNTGGTSGGYNGGGSRDTYSGGGGATHIANAAPSGSNYQLRYYSSTSDQQKILVVAGGGGSDGASTNSGGYGGGTTGGAGSGSWGTATAGGFGYGAKGVYQSSGYGGAGGGGWSGGSGITADTSSDDDKGGSGGSGYVNTSLTDAETIAGNATMPNPDGGTMTGREGNGYARITFYIQHHITCASQPKQVALTVTPLTTPSAQDKTICPGTTASLSVQSPVSGYTYHWQSESGSDTGTGNSFTTASLDNTTTYQITATKAFDEIVAAYDFDYSGEMQDVVAPSGADYAILEVWGAEGGSSRANNIVYAETSPNGGKGGYAKGKMEVSSGQHFYVVVGGKGQDAVLGPGAAVVTAKGGYNGGGGGTSDNEGTSFADREAAGGGGGATHIAKAAPSSGTDYQLYYYSSNQDDVLLVAGGGGGASYTQTGGYGGGTAGGRISNGGSGGTQTAGASSGTQIAGVFGRGANASGNGNGYGNGVGGGGGGWYGGNVNTVTNKNYNSGGGGSGHINTTQLTNTTILAGNNASIPNIAGTGTETGHSGNGHARIVFYKNGGGECASSVANVDAIVNTPSVGSLTFTTDQNICPGTAVTLQVTSANPTASEGLSYVWKKGSSTLGTSSSYETTAEGTYNVKVTATNIVNGKTCTADQSQDIIVTYKKPSAEELTDMGAANGYYIWTGKSDDWSTANNWMKYTASPETYALTATLPASASVAVGKYNTCVSGSPTLNINEPATVRTFNLGTGVTVSGSSTLTVSGAVTNNGTINGSLAMTISGALTNSGTINGSTTMSVTGNVTNSGTIGSSSTMSVSGALTNSDSGTVNSSLTLNGSNKTLTNNGTLNAPAVFNGSTTLAGSGSTTFSSVTINSTKTLKTSGHNITISGDCTNNGTLTAGTGSITMTGNLANNGTFTGAGGNISITGDLTNASTFKTGAGALSLIGNLTNNGTFTANTGAITMTGNLTNSGTFNGAGGTISITGDLTNASTSTFKTVAGALSLNGNLTNSGTFTIGGAGAVTLTGNWTNNGTFTPTGAGAVIFAGTSSQVIGGSNATTFKNVQFSNSANSLSISNEPTITGTATFSSGVVSGNVTLGSAATVSGAGTTSYVNGKVTKVMNANATFKFPIGTASLYAPFEAKSSAATNVSVQYASGSEDMPDWWNHSGNFSNVGLDHASDRENWQVSASATTNLSAIKLYWNTAAGNYHSFEEGADALESYLRIAAVKKNSFYWQNLGQSAIEGDFDGAGSITAATPLAITVGAKAAGDNDYFVTFASTNKGNLLLPIELTSFTATCDGRSTLVEWTTASERNNDYFSLERSDDAINFTEIARVAGAGNSIEPIDYAYNDYGIHGGDNYYRLVQVDYDGTRTVSEIVVANCIESEVDEPEVQAYPNPFNGELTLVLDNFDNRPATIEVYDMLGKLIYIQKADAPLNSYETILNLSNLPSGAYNVRVSTADFVINRNVVKN